MLNSQEWEKVRGTGNAAVEKWIQDQMSYKKAVIVLIGQKTAGRSWVTYEIEKAWEGRRPLLGIRIHGLSSMGAVDSAGSDPFLQANEVVRVPIFDPTVTNWLGKIDSKATYNKLRENLEAWSGQGIVRPK